MAKSNLETLKNRAGYFATAFELIASGKYQGSLCKTVKDTLEFLDKEHTKVVDRIKKNYPEEIQEND